VVSAEATEGTGADLFLAVLEENGVTDGGNDFTVPFDGNQLGSTDLSLLSRVYVHSDWNRKEVAFAGLVGHGVHLN
jgi:hypothetical protein